MCLGSGMGTSDIPSVVGLYAGLHAWSVLWSLCNWVIVSLFLFSY